jgi:RNA polymerase sigma-70 factor, ECF subfamily
MNDLERNFKKITGGNFSDFYNDYKPKLKWHLSNYTGDLSVAEDFAHDALIQGLQKLHQFDSSKSQIQTWITTIGRNLVIKEWKDRKKMPKVSLDKETNEESNTSLINFIPYDDGKKKKIKEKETNIKYKITLKAINNLPIKYKQVIEMRELNKMPYKEIADKLNRNLSTVKSQIRKGRQLIINSIEKKFDYIDKNGIDEL